MWVFSYLLLNDINEISNALLGFPECYEISIVLVHPRGHQEIIIMLTSLQSYQAHFLSNTRTHTPTSMYKLYLLKEYQEPVSVFYNI